MYGCDCASLRVSGLRDLVWPGGRREEWAGAQERGRVWGELSAGEAKEMDGISGMFRNDDGGGRY